MESMTDAFLHLYRRELIQLKQEITAYETESNLWRTDRTINNSGGALCVHLIGNLNHFVGVGLGQTGYVRDREFEFSGQPVPRTELLPQIDATQKMMEQVISTLSDEDLSRDFSMNIRQNTVTIAFALTHLYGHLNYHVGQINYHRRLLDA